jgi:hypothetical protein
MNLKEYALFYVRDLKWSLFPCAPGSKKPLIKWGPYMNRLPSPEEVEQWWTKWPQANIGIVCGKVSGLLCVDIDSRRAQEYYRAVYGEIHNTVRQNTGRPGGLHLLFRYPRDGRSYGNIGEVAREKPGSESIDIHARGNGGFFVAAPSVHPNGTVYNWIVDPTDSPDDIMELPEVVKGLWGFTQKENSPKPQPESQNKATEPKEGLDIDRYLMGADEPGFPGAGEGGRIIGRDTACTRLAGWYLRRFKGDLEETRRVLYIWGPRCRPPFPEKDINKCLESISKRHRQETISKDGSQTLFKKIEKYKYPDGDVSYQVYVDGYEGYVTMTPEDFISRARFKTKFFKLTDISPKLPKGDEWDDWLTAVMKTAVHIEVPADETNLGALLHIIEEECSPGRSCTDMDMVKDHVVVNNGSAFFTTNYLSNALQFAGIKISAKETGSLLRRMNCSKTNHRTGSCVHKVWEMKLNPDV